LLDGNTLFLFDLKETLDYRDAQDARAHASLRETASNWLREAGETYPFTVSDDAEEIKESAGTKEPDTGADGADLQRWWFQIGRKHGFVSRTAIAAEFVAASDRVHRLTDGNEELRHAIYQFARAAYWMQYEASGEHERAVRNVGGLAKGPTAKKDKANHKQKILKDVHDEWAADANERDRANPKQAAHELLEKVNAKLTMHGFEEYKDEESLIKKLRPLMTQRVPQKR
jgi:hypothetical protein